MTLIRCTGRGKSFSFLKQTKYYHIKPALLLFNKAKPVLWRPQAHRCSPTRRKAAFWHYAKSNAVVRVWASGYAPSAGGRGGQKGRQAPAISRATAAALPGGQHGTPRMQMLAEAAGRTEGLTAGPRFVLAQAPTEGGPEGLVPDVSERSRQRRTKREWRGVEADEGPEARPDARELRRKTSTGGATQERNPASFLDEAVRRVRAKWPGSLRRSAETPTHGTQRASRHRGRPQAWREW